MQLPATAARVLIGQSPRIRQVVEQIDRMSDHRWPVLVLGETGTGKELIAKLIHSRSTPGPFVVVDCSSLVGALMESELFGHVKGSFTGASGTKIGLVEVANGGTAFFDEIGELPIELQAKLLRVLQEKEYRPVGSTHPRRSDFRVISATNRDLNEAAEKGTFRKDLLYRLKVVTLRLPALRERKDDIPELVRVFLQRYGNNHTVAPEAMDALLAYEWPGNVRELENCVQHMVAVNAGPLLHLYDLPSPVLNHVANARSQLLGLAAAVGVSAARPAYAPPAVEIDTEPIFPLAQLEQREILRAIRRTRGDRTAAASLLGIGRTTLYRKLKEYGFDL
jgi:transcriptional regulator with PAS, ATPase and Fis domain